MAIKAIIHDWDDTITNAFETYSQFYVDFGKHYGLGDITIDDVRPHWGQTIPEIAKGTFPHLSKEGVVEKIEEFAKLTKHWRKTSEVKIFPGVRETIEKLNKDGITLGSISSGHRPTMEKVYRKQICPDISYHKFLFDSKDLGISKPNAGAFDKPFGILSEYGIGEKDTIYVGDSFQDYEAAKNGGLVFYAVTTGTKTKEDFIKEGLEEKYILENFSDLLNILD